MQQRSHALLSVPQGIGRTDPQIAMETAPAGFSVRLRVDVKVGRTWADWKWARYGLRKYAATHPCPDVPQAE